MKLLTFPYTAEQLANVPYAPDWKVESYSFTEAAKRAGSPARVPYGYWVLVTIESGERCYWQVPDIFRNWRYDTRQAQFVG